MGLARTDVKEQMDGECAEFIPRQSYNSWGTAELARSVSVFVRGPEPVYGTTGSSAPAFRWTQTWEAPLSGIHAWDQVILA